MCGIVGRRLTDRTSDDEERKTIGRENVIDICVESLDIVDLFRVIKSNFWRGEEREVWGVDKYGRYSVLLNIPA